MTTAPTAAQAVTAGPRRLHREALLRAANGRSLLHYLGVALSAALLILTLAVAVAVVALPALVGGSAMTVLTQSMEPGLPPGTLVVIKPTPVDDIAVGDVMTYQIRSGESAVVTHRVISKTYAAGEVTFITQGDNNTAPDAAPVQEVQVRGTLWYSLPLLGWANTALNGPHRPIVVAIAVGGLFSYAAAMVIGSLRERRRQHRDEPTDEVSEVDAGEGDAAGKGDVAGGDITQQDDEGAPGEGAPTQRIPLPSP